MVVSQVPTKKMIAKRMANGLTEAEAVILGYVKAIFEVKKASEESGLPVCVIQFRIKILGMSIEEAVDWGVQDHPPLEAVSNEYALSLEKKSKMKRETCSRKKQNLEKSRQRPCLGGISVSFYRELLRLPPHVGA